MTWKEKNPFINVTNKIYETGIKVKKEIMKIYEGMLERAEHIGKWFITINPEKCKEVLEMEFKVQEIIFGVRGKYILFYLKSLIWYPFKYNFDKTKFQKAYF